MFVTKKDGLVDKKREKEYEANPAMLEKDTRATLYFTFVSIASSGGYL